MALLKPKNQTIEAKLAAHNAAGDAAVAAFEKAANDLEFAANGLFDAADEAQDQLDNLLALRNAAAAAGRKNLASAEKLRGLFA